MFAIILKIKENVLMKKVAIVLLVFILLVGAFCSGIIFNSKPSTNATSLYEYQSEGYEKMGKFNLIIEIDDFDNTPGEETILVDVGSNDGFYLEYPYASEIFISANYYAIDFNPDDSGCTIEDDKVGFDFVDNYTLLLYNDDNTQIIFDEIVVETSSGTIFKGHIDCYGYDKDESDIYYFATNYEKFNSLYSEDCGEPSFYPSGAFSNYKSKKIYL